MFCPSISIGRTSVRLLYLNFRNFLLQNFGLELKKRGTSSISSRTSRKCKTRSPIYLQCKHSSILFNFLLLLNNIIFKRSTILCIRENYRTRLAKFSTKGNKSFKAEKKGNRLKFNQISWRKSKNLISYRSHQVLLPLSFRKGQKQNDQHVSKPKERCIVMKINIDQKNKEKL